uniref:Uncharacterized protein n=1 Tax=Oryza meridionalis TaxID=40149 RepID=A0A0E0DPT0_9ORYZ
MSHDIATSPLSSGDSFPLSFLNSATKETRSEAMRVDIKAAGGKGVNQGATAWIRVVTMDLPNMVTSVADLHEVVEGAAQMPWWRFERVFICSRMTYRCHSGLRRKVVVLEEKEVVQAPDQKPSEKVRERVHLVSPSRGLPPSPSATAKLADCARVGIGEVGGGASPSTRCATNTWDPVTATNEGTLICANNSDRRRRGGREGARSSRRREGD